MADAAPPGGLAGRFPALLGLGRAGRQIAPVQQLAATDCGPSCLAMALGYHGRAVGRDELREALDAGRNGTTARGLLAAARHFGLRARGVKVEPEGLKYLPKASILHWDFNHFIVFDRVTPGGVDVVDPALGRRRVPLDEFGRSFTGVALVLEPGGDFKPGEGRPKARGANLWPALRASGSWARIMTTSVFVQALTLSLPLLTGAVVDRVIPRGDRHMLLVLSAGLAGVVAFSLLATAVRAHLLLEMRTLADARLTLGFVEHLMRLPYGFFQRRSAGDLLMRLNSNVLIRQALTSSALSGALDGALMLGYLALLFAASAKTGLLVLLLAALQVSVFAATRGRRRDASAASIARQARAQAYQVEIISGIETLKAAGAEPRALEHWSNLFVDVLNGSLAEGRLDAAVEAATGALRTAAPLAILGFGAHNVLNGELSLGAMLAVNTFAVGVFAPLSNLVTTATQLQQLGTHVDRIDDVWQTPPEQRPFARPAPDLKGGIELEHVSFRYGPLEPLVVDDVSLSIDPGHLVAIVGKSGSGKSTLASLLLGLYPPTEGRIAYDGASLADLDLRSVRRQLGIVTQRAYLFGTSIRANITLSDPGASHEDVVRASKLAHIHDDVERMPMGYDTLLTDGGGSLSGGQRQRIALARALVRRPAVLLLDEATSALDAITERKVQESLEALSATRIVIAHRLSTVMRADRILVVDRGRLVEQGAHRELLAKGGLYAKLVESQLERPGPDARPA